MDIEWPLALPFDDRLSDLALLINQDQLPQLRDRILSQEQAPAETFLPFLDDIGDVLYGPRALPQSDTDSSAGLGDIGFRIRGCAKAAIPTRRRIRQIPLGASGAIQKWEDEDTLDIKDELLRSLAIATYLSGNVNDLLLSIQMEQLLFSWFQRLQTRPVAFREKELAGRPSIRPLYLSTHPQSSIIQWTPNKYPNAVESLQYLCVRDGSCFSISRPNGYLRILGRY